MELEEAIQKKKIADLEIDQKRAEIELTEMMEAIKQSCKIQLSAEN